VSWRPAFESPDHAPQALGAQLWAITADMRRDAQSPGAASDSSANFEFKSQLVAALVDTNGRVITTTMPTAYSAQAPLADLEPPAAHSISDAANGGVTDTARLA
jgi:hypothetical protein